MTDHVSDASPAAHGAEVGPSAVGPIALGMIGVGTIGSLQQQVVSSQHWLGFEIVAAADPVPDRLDLLDASVSRYASHDALLCSPEVTAVSICTPPNTHYHIAAEALRAGKHVFLEKPPALSLGECEALIRLANDHGRVLFMAYHTRYNPVVLAAQRELRGKTIKRIAVEYKEDVYTYHDPSGWIFDPEFAGGGVLMDSGINVASVITALVPSAGLMVTDARLSRHPSCRVETGAKVQFMAGQHCKGEIDMDWMAPGQETRRFLVEADTGTYELDLARGILRKDPDAHSHELGDAGARVDQHTEYTLAYADFALHLARGQSNAPREELGFILHAYSVAGNPGR